MKSHNFITGLILALCLCLLCAFAVAEETNALDGDETTEDFVYRMYTTVLGREPDDAGFEFWVNKLDSGECGAAEIVSGFFNSNEYNARNKSNEEIVTDCYNAMLGREPDEAGKEFWEERLDVGMSADAVCAGFVDSTEFGKLADHYGIDTGSIKLTKARDTNYAQTAFVYRLYEDCLGREAETDGLEFWCNKLNQGMGGTEVASGFVFSNESKNKAADNDEYVEMLYRTILGRDSEEEGKNYWVNKLDYSISREAALNGFMNSNEFNAKCAKAGVKIGDKIATPDSTEAWQTNVVTLSLVNAERAKEGLPFLKTREDLWEKVAQVRATELSVLYDEHHTRPDGSLYYTAYRDARMPLSDVAELNASGYKTAQDVVKAWMNSPTHRAIIMSDQYTNLATGICTGDKTFWNQNYLQAIK